MIIADGITKSFDGKQVLDRISFQVGTGEIFGLLGPSGAGKTTLIRILTGQLAPDTGSCLIGDKTHDRKESPSGQFGIMMDDLGVYDRLSCLENLRIFAMLAGIADDAVHSTLAMVGLADAAKTVAADLSKGMKNRLRLARAFLCKPPLLFLDEPTSGLDPAAADGIRRMILAERERGCTIFLTTHNMAEAETLCDRIALLCDGRIVEYGTPAEICRRCDHQSLFLVRHKDGTELRISHDAAGVEQLCTLLREGDAKTIHTTEPNLETVFMELTGKELSA